MGWLWTCLGLRGKSSRRIGGRVSSVTYLAPQFDPTKTPRIEDYLQARQAGYDVFVNGHSPTSPRNCDKDLAAAGTNGTLKGTPESIKAEYGPYWGYSDASPAREEFASIGFPRARKSFSELLMKTDTLERGPLALAAMAAAAERAARIKSNAFPGFDVKEASKAEDSQKATLRSDTSEAVECPTPHSMPMQEAASISSLSKDHLEASKAVAAFKESRRKAQLSSQQQTTVANPSYINSLFRSPKKRTIPVKSRSLQRPLSPVPEALSRDQSKRARDVSLPVVACSHPSDGISSSIMESFSCELETSANPSAEDASHEDWDDYVLVERVPETPNTVNVENQTQDVRPSATSSIIGGIHEEDSSSKAAFQDDATSARQVALGSEGREEEDSQVLRTPVRDLMVTPEVFMSPKTSSAEYNFQRVNDMDPEERPIFGSLADHWEAAWATKRPVWDGRGILNDTNKYKEDQKVMWHAVPFEERLAQALATQEDSVLQRNSYKSPTSRLSTSRSSRSLRAH